MKITLMLCLGIVFFNVDAQTTIPKGFKNGVIVLADSSAVHGFIKDNIRRNASIVFRKENGQGKIDYHGSDLISVEIEGTKFLCIRGDFFRILSEGELFFLQKSSDASGIPSYNGNEAIFSNGTEGRPLDYFIYDKKNKQLKLVSKKNMNEVATLIFSGYAPAMDKIKAADADISRLKEAVDIYNSRNIN
jgi:hypothetical protein